MGGIASGLAAVAALVAILYARLTVHEAKLGREQSRAAHIEAVAEQKAAAQALACAHREEMTERHLAHEAELTMQRIVAIQQTSKLLLELIDVAREEAINPPPLLNPPLPFRAT